MELTRASIQEMYDKFKTLIQNDGFFYGILIVLVALSSFGLGRISEGHIEINAPKNAIQFTQKASVVEATTSQSANSLPASSKTGSIVASKSGTKYHLLTCPGAKQIKEENKIFFKTAKDAENAGYSKASNCKGL